MPIKEADCSCGKVYYAILKGSRCVFTGGNPHRSTTEAAGEIIERIGREEDGIEIEDMQFFDLLTHQGWRPLREGEYEYHKVIFRVDTRLSRRHPDTAPPIKTVYVSDWQKVPCPEEVLQLFQKHIGGPKKHPGPEFKSQERKPRKLNRHLL